MYINVIQLPGWQNLETHPRWCWNPVRSLLMANSGTASLGADGRVELPAEAPKRIVMLEWW